MYYLFLILALSFNSIANILMKIGAKNIHFFNELSLIDGILKNYILLIGLFCFGLNIIFYTISLSKINLTIAYPILVGGSVIIISLFSFLYLKESINLYQILGIIFVIAGISLLSVKI